MFTSFEWARLMEGSCFINQCGVPKNWQIYNRCFRETNYSDRLVDYENFDIPCICGSSERHSLDIVRYRGAFYILSEHNCYTISKYSCKQHQSKKQAFLSKVRYIFGNFTGMGFSFKYKQIIYDRFYWTSAMKELNRIGYRSKSIEIMVKLCYIGHPQISLVVISH